MTCVFDNNSSSVMIVALFYGETWTFSHGHLIIIVVQEICKSWYIDLHVRCNMAFLVAKLNNF
jgi:hypothetical protein